MLRVGDKVRVRYRLSGGQRNGVVEYIDGAYVGVRMNRSGCIFEAYENELTKQGMHQ